jgi:hypothetical protein
MVAAQVALCLTALTAVLAVLLDGGMLLSERRHAQATADAAAMAAASDLYYNWPNNSGSDPNGTATASALSVASKNGYTNNGTTSTVTVNGPGGTYAGGPNKNSTIPAGYAEVIVTWYQTRGFSAIYGSGSIPVSARAVGRAKSTNGASSLPGILLLGNTGTTLSVGGNGTVDVTDPSGYTGSGGSIYVDSTGPDAVNQNGNHAEATAPSAYVAQTGSAPAGLTVTSGSVNMGAPQITDPLSYLPAPSQPAAGTQSGSTYSPGYFANGISLSGQSSITLQPGIYYLGGSGLSLSGQASISGSGVMIYLTGSKASIDLSGQGTVNLSPMTSGPYAGITFFQDRSDTQGDTLVGNGNLNISGTIYAPAATVNATGNGSGDVFASQIIANSMTTQGNGTVKLQFDPSTLKTPWTRTLGLVE